MLTDAAESCSLFLVLCLQFVGHYNSTNLAEYVQGILHNGEDEEPEALIN